MYIISASFTASCGMRYVNVLMLLYEYEWMDGWTDGRTEWMNEWTIDFSLLTDIYVSLSYW